MFRNLGSLLRLLELIPASRERVVPTEWQVHTVLGDCTDPDEDDEVPRNEPGTSSNNQPPVPVLLLHKDQHPVHTVHRPVLLRPVHQEHRPLPVVRMNPLTMRTIMEKENLAQQHKVHEVMTPEEQCSIQTFTF